MFDAVAGHLKDTSKKFTVACWRREIDINCGGLNRFVDHGVHRDSSRRCASVQVRRAKVCLSHRLRDAILRVAAVPHVQRRILTLSSSILIASRKRKLRELYAVVRHVEFQRDFPPLPPVPAGQPVPPYLSWSPTENAEKLFLEGNDLTKYVNSGAVRMICLLTVSRDFYFDERTLPKPAPRPPEQLPAVVETTNGVSLKLTSPSAPINAPSPTTQLPLTPAPSTEEFAGSHAGSQPKRLSIDAGVQKSIKGQQPPSPVDEPAPSLESKRRRRDSGKENWQSADTTSETTTITPPHERQTISPPSLSPSTSFPKSQDRSAPIAVIGGVPVIQSIHPESSARSKGSKDGILVGPEAAVHPPPPPASLHEEEVPKGSGASSLPSPQESSAVMEEDISEKDKAPVSEESAPTPITDVDTVSADKSSSMRLEIEKVDDPSKSVSKEASSESLPETETDVREDPNAQLRMELERAKEVPDVAREDVEMEEAPKTVEVPGSVKEPVAERSLPNVSTEKPVDVEAISNAGVKPAAVSDEVEMEGIEPTEDEKAAQVASSSKDVEMTEAEVETEKTDIPLAETSESVKNIQAATAKEDTVVESAVSAAEKDADSQDVHVSGADKQKRLSGPLAQESLAASSEKRASDKRGDRQRKSVVSAKGEPYLDRQKFTLRRPKDVVEEEALKEANQSISLYKRQQQQPEPPLSLLRFLYTIDSSASLQKALQASHKTLTTQNHALAYHEVVAQRVLTRVMQLEDAGKWGLRQPPRVPEPKRRETHWDFLLREARWLREDFKEERKWKVATARTVALWCQDWVEASPLERKAMQVRPRIPEPRAEETAVDVVDANKEAAAPAPVTVEPAEKPPKIEDEDVEMDLEDEIPSIFSNVDDVPDALSSQQFSLSASQSLVASLIEDGIPIYKPPTLPSQEVLEEGIDEPWQLPIVPVTKYLTAKVNIVENKYSRKRSRFDYDPNPEQFAEDSGDENYDFEGPRKRQQIRRPASDPPLQNDCALFNPSAKGILNRAAQATALKPPLGSHIPQASFFTSRQPSQWTQQDDELLKEAIQNYPQNWPLISTSLIPKGEFHSSVERRSPWECFERHVFMLDSLPPEFSKNQFYRGIQQRLEMAQKGGEAYINNSAGQASGQNTPTIKRKGTMPIRVDKKRGMRHINLVEAMRRLAKKREASVSKQHNGTVIGLVDFIIYTNNPLAAAVRKPETTTGPKNVTQTPEHFSKMKHEWEMKQQMKIQQQQQIQLQRVGSQDRSQGQSLTSQAAMIRNNPQLAQQQALAHAAANQPGHNLVVPSSQKHIVGQHAMHRPSPAMGHLPNGTQQQVAAQVPHGIPQSNLLQVPRPGQQAQPYTQEQLQRLMMEQNRVKALQHQQAQMQAAQAAQAQAQRDAQATHASPVPMTAGLPMNFASQNGTNIVSQAHLIQAQQQQQAALNSAAAANGQKPIDHLSHSTSGAPRTTIDHQLPMQPNMNSWTTQSTVTHPGLHQSQVPQSLAAQNVNSAQQMQEYHKRLRELMGPSVPGAPSPQQQHAALNAAAGANMGNQPANMHLPPNQQQIYQMQMLRQQNQIQAAAARAAQAQAQQAAVAAAAGGSQALNRSATPQTRPGSVGAMSQASPRMGQVQQVNGQGGQPQGQ